MEGTVGKGCVEEVLATPSQGSNHSKGPEDAGPVSCTTALPVASGPGQSPSLAMCSQQSSQGGSP